MRSVLLACTLASVGVFAKDIPSPLTRDGNRLVLSPGIYAGLKKATWENIRVTGFPLGAQTVTLDLARFEVLTPDAQIVVGSPEGDKPLPRPDVILLRGKIAGVAESEVYLSLTPTGSRGWIETPNDRLLLCANEDGSSTYVTREELASATVDDWTCGVIPTGTECDADVSAADATWPRVCSVAIETDYEFTGNVFHGNSTASTTYVATLMGAMDTIYRRDFKTQMVVPYIRIWTENNDPWSAGNTGDELGAFVNYWNANMGGVKRTLAHFLSGRALGGGVAYLTVLCNGTYGYGLSANLGGFFPPALQRNAGNWDPFVVAHEIGHNFGNPHTHDYNPPLDTCGLGCTDPPFWTGTIMSYCHVCSGGMNNINLKFHPQMIIDTEARLSTTFLNCVTKTQVRLSLQPEFYYPAGVNIGGNVKFYDATSHELRSSTNFWWNGQTVNITGPVGKTEVEVKLGNWLIKKQVVDLFPPQTAMVQFNLTNGDANKDNVVDVFDINTVLAYFGSGLGMGDLNWDRIVDVYDMNIVFLNFGISGD